jgi:ABC-type branched-subunit amino acid transport system permease subunit
VYSGKVELNRRIEITVTGDALNRQGAQLYGHGRHIAVICACAALLAAPYIGVNGFGLFLLTKALALALWAVGLDLLVGYTGLISFGHSAWLGLGAYAAGYIAREYTTDIFAALLAAAAVVAIVAGVAGLVATRVSGVPFAIVTLAIAATVYLVIVRLPPEFIGGRTGLFGVPAPSVFGRTIAYGNELYLATTALTISVVLILSYLVRTPFGRALQAIRDNETRARFIGINVSTQRWAAFVLSAVVSSFGGVMLCFLQGGMSTLEFQWLRSADVLVMVLLGGLGSLYGPIVGAIFFSFVFTNLISWFPREWQIYMGLMFLAVVLFLPGGFAGAFERLWGRVWTSP